MLNASDQLGSLATQRRYIPSAGVRALSCLIFVLICVPIYFTLDLILPVPKIAPKRFLHLVVVTIMLLELISRDQPIVYLRAFREVKTEIFCIILINLFIFVSHGRYLPDIKSMVHFALNDFADSFIVFTATAIFVRSDGDIRYISRVVLMTAFVVLSLVLLEHSQKKPLFADTFASLAGSAKGNVTSFNFISDKSRDGLYRAQGGFSHPLVLSDFAAIAVPICLAMLLSPKSQRPTSLAIGALLATFVAVYLTFTRTPQIVAGLTLFIFMIGVNISRNTVRNDFMRVYLTIVTITCLCLTLFVFSSHAESLVSGRTSEEMSSSQSRFLMLERGYEWVRHSPLVGYGWLDGPQLAALGKEQSVDNHYLVIALAAGIPASLLLLLLHSAVVIKCLASAWAHTRCRLVYLAIASMVSGMALTKVVYTLPDLHFMLYFAIGLYAAARSSERASNAAWETDKANSPISRTTRQSARDV